MPRPVVHWEIGGRDARKLQEFYGALFEWDMDTSNPDYAMVPPGDSADSPGTGGAIGGGIMQLREEMPGYLTFYVQVDDLAATLGRAEELGGTQIIGPTPVPEVGEIAMLSDPEGNLVGLFKSQA